MKLIPKKTQWVTVLREKLGLSQIQLAQQLGVSKAAISMVESDRRTLPGAALLKLVELEKKMTAAIDSNTLTGFPEHNKDLPVEATQEFSQPRQQQYDIQLNHLTAKLEVMEARYKKLRAQLQLVDKMLEKEPAGQPNGLILSLQVQRDRIVSKISRCNPKEQSSLRNKIAVLNAEVNFHKG
ncbi:MAG TPA: helix-turn-helix transcriptional regulator [Chitinophagaceae bacterium]|jgi:transcriptional regulator with XRE-family HTH domain|nr:helix-turn-helix transcriptional regulator [Chitinophagaceae bacterium]